MLKMLRLSLMTIFLLPSVLSAGEVEPDVASKKLVESLSGISSMYATFEQWVTDAKQNSLQHVTGKMWIERPGQFRWDTDEPYPQIIVSDGKTLLIYDKDLEQATKKKLDKQVGNTPALLLSGDPTSIDDHFIVSAYLFEESKEWRFDLRPKDSEAMFALLRVHFFQNNIRDLYLEDSLGQTTRIEFTTLSKNKPIEPSIFTLKLDESVDIIEEM